MSKDVASPTFTKNKGEIHVTAVLDESGQPRLFVQWPPGAAEYEGRTAAALEDVAELRREIEARWADWQRVTPALDRIEAALRERG